ncbi:MAG: C25 family cysteine peptidase [Planctomycetaceae bacterium]|jgi:hypothetical protein|nr:C25 family cysteine peptidase [Planctomycetaceae bacterium]
MTYLFRRFLFATHFTLAFIIGYIPAWGESAAEHAGLNNEAVAVLCPGVFRQSLQPWIDYRISQGYKIYLLEEPKSAQFIEKTSDGRVHNIVPSVTPEYLKKRIRELAGKDPALKYLLIIGDGAPDVTSEPMAAARLIPPAVVPARVVSMFGRKDKEIPSDNYYADLDDDHVPELAVGRISVSTPAELEIIVQKILTYEHNSDNSFWKRRLNFIAGVGGFSPLLDGVIESTAKHVLSEMISEGYDLSLTQANWKSPFCPDPELFRSVTVERLNEGCLFWVYLGHGYHKALDLMRTPEGNFPVFAEGDSGYVDCRSGLPIAVFCACYTGAFDGPENCLAESLIRRPKGPVAVIAATRVAMPYGMAVFGTGFIEHALSREPHNLGTIFLNAKRNMILPQKNSVPKQSIRGMIDSVAWWTDPTSRKLNDQLIDHLYLFQLFGDPLLKVPFPQNMTVTCKEKAVPGEIIQVSGQVDFDGPIYVELVKPRTAQPLSVPDRKKFQLTEKSRIEYMKEYRAANNRAILYVPGRVVNGRFQVPVKIPDDLDGDYLFRCFTVSPEGTSSIGSRPFHVTPPVDTAQSLHSIVR